MRELTFLVEACRATAASERQGMLGLKTPSGGQAPGLPSDVVRARLRERGTTASTGRRSWPKESGHLSER